MTGFEVHDGTQPIGALNVRLTELIEGLAHQGAIFSRHGDEALGPQAFNGILNRLGLFPGRRGIALM